MHLDSMVARDVRSKRACACWCGHGGGDETTLERNGYNHHHHYHCHYHHHADIYPPTINANEAKRDCVSEYHMGGTVKFTAAA
jgi:hypothetical protein